MHHPIHLDVGTTLPISGAIGPIQPAPSIDRACYFLKFGAWCPPVEVQQAVMDGGVVTTQHHERLLSSSAYFFLCVTWQSH
mmetsp:Transcript_25892/g.43148  ORF Transcript_25892/g.43148 Transcript_25892/m.43148 type:complete len:81 (-) Transcript_25892:46-288(-)